MQMASLRTHSITEQAPLLAGPHCRIYASILDSSDPSSSHDGCTPYVTTNDDDDIPAEKTSTTWAYRINGRGWVHVVPESEPIPQQSRSTQDRLNFFVGSVMFTAILGLAFLAVSSRGIAHSEASSEIDVEYRPSSYDFAPADIQHSWSAYTPYFPVKPYALPPSDCKISQVSLRTLLLLRRC